MLCRLKDKVDILAGNDRSEIVAQLSHFKKEALLLGRFQVQAPAASLSFCF